MSKFRNHILKTLYGTSGPGPVDPGVLPGVFSVSATRKVKFSKGNLQYKASTNTWRLAENQYDYVGNSTDGTVYEDDVKCDNALVSSGYTGWIDLFGWGATGKISENPYLQPPYSVSTSNSDFKTQLSSSSSEILTRENYADWGVCIENSLWKTLSNTEWNYLLNTRVVNGGTGVGYSYDKCLTTDYNGSIGIVLFPNNFTKQNTWKTEYPTWETFTAAGLVFLPSAGRRRGQDDITLTGGNYWTTAAYSSSRSMLLDITNSTNKVVLSNQDRCLCATVRLVQDYEEPTELYVDLGLSVLWTTMNLGASKPQDYGDYYAWGEIEPYHADGYSTESPCTHWREMSTGAGNVDLSSGYAWKTYSQGGTASFTEWTTLPYDSGTSILLPERDAATHRLGEHYRMPTQAEWTELNSNCTWTWTTNYNGTGIQGYIVTSNVTGYTDKYIFLPATGRIDGDTHSQATIYYSSVRGLSTASQARGLQIYNGSHTPSAVSSRYLGNPIRAVRKKETRYVDLGLSVLWANRNIGASNPENAGNYYAFGETTTKSSYNWNTYAHGTSSTSLTKYNTRSAYGTVDNKTILDDEDDIATVLDNETRIPLGREWTELADTNNCTWEWLASGTYSTNIPTFKALSNGYLVISKVSGFEGNHIFLPAAGFNINKQVGNIGNYGSKNIDATEDYDFQIAYFTNNSINTNYAMIRPYGVSVRQIKQKEGYVAFTEATFSSNILNITDRVSINDDYLEFSFKTSSGYERLKTPIYNLEVGRWYSITFSELLEKVGSTSQNIFGNLGSYGCTVLADVNLSTNYTEIVTYQSNAVSTNGDTAFNWVNMDGWSTNNYTSINDVKIVFKATASIMYWAFDLSKITDGYNYKWHLNLSGSKLEKIDNINNYYIDFLNTTYYGFTTTAGSLAETDAKRGVITYKTDALNNDKLKITIRTQSGKFEKINIPINNLSVGKNYNITFTHKSTANSFLNKYDLCYGFKDAPNTDVSNTTYKDTVGYTQNIPTSTYVDFTTSRSFTATAPTMYWIWSISDISDGKWYNEEITNVQITEESFTELEYISADGQQYIDTEYQPKGTTTVECKVNIGDLGSQGIFGSEIQGSKYYDVLSIASKTVRDGYNTTAGEAAFNWAEFYDKTVQITKTPTGTTLYAEEDGLTRTHSYSQASFTLAYNVYVFAVNRSGSALNIVTGQLYDFYIKEGTNLIMHLKPVKRNRDGKVGMLDDVTGRFFISATGTDFYAGPVKIIDSGILPGIFSVSADKKVQFSKGNLQYLGNGTVLGEHSNNPYWRFATNQWDYIGTKGAVSQFSTSTTADRDLLGWGTSGYLNCNPYNVANNLTYGPNGNINISGTDYDWGIYNSIYNGGQLSGLWNTLSSDEFTYLLITRTITVGGETKSSYGNARIHSTYGLIILPDNWDGSANPAFVYGQTDARQYNQISDDVWRVMENAGAVFLPCAGGRSVTSASKVGSSGRYWSTNSNTDSKAEMLAFDYNVGPSISNLVKYVGYSVRLVKEYIEPEPEPLPHYIENGVDYGEGIKIGNTIWAPVNVGTDTNNLYGKLFQWGRQYGQNGTGTCTVSAITKEQGESLGYIDIFGQTNDSNSNWYDGTIDDTLWTNTKKNYDPCPEGWRLPTYEELNALYGNNTTPELIEVDGKYGCYFNGTSTASSGVFMTAGGYRDLDGEAKDIATGGNYLTSTPNGIYAKYLEFANGTAEIKNTARVYGNSVRAVYDPKTYLINLIDYDSFDLDENITKNDKNTLKFSIDDTAKVAHIDRTSPKLGHKYYGRYEIMANNSVTVTDESYQYWTNDIQEGGVYTGRMVFGDDRYRATNNIYRAFSSIKYLNTINTESGWMFRTYAVNNTQPIQKRNHLLIDLTEAFGAGNEPTKEWCDFNIPFFNGTYELEDIADSNLYRYAKLEITEIVSGNIVQLSRWQFLDKDDNVLPYQSYSCCEANIEGNSYNEQANSLLGSTHKYCTSNYNSSLAIILDYGLNCIDFTKYNRWRFYTGGDTTTYPSRNPKSFKLYISKDKVNWELVDEVNNASLPTENVVVAYTGEVRVKPHYVEEGTDYGTGIEINGITWAPVNVGIGENYAYPNGKLYQWGRTYGQAYEMGTITPTSMNKTDDTEENKDKFGKYNSTDNNWFSGGVDDSLWNGKLKGEKDPCPLNWRVPTLLELDNLKGGDGTGSGTIGGSGWDNTNKGYWFNGTTSPSLGIGLFLPASGFREIEHGGAAYLDDYGMYWTSTVNNTNAWRLRFINSNGVDTAGTGSRARGYSIRAIYIHPIPQDCILPGIFSISPTSTVRFSKGNLQATYNGSIYNWYFAENQYDIIGNNIANTSTITTNGTRDLFGFSTSATNYGINTSTSDSTYSGDFVDWGANPYLKRNVGEGWSTLTKAEWQYLISTRTVTVDDVAKPSYGGACVNTINGLILLPDDWDGSVCPDFVYGFSSYLVNSFTAEQWKDMEEAGCVFLPSAGYRSGTAVSGVVGAVESLGYYWSSTVNGTSNGYDVQVSTTVNPIGSIGRSIGHSVRLVLRG